MQLPLRQASAAQRAPAGPLTDLRQNTHADQVLCNFVHHYSTAKTGFRFLPTDVRAYDEYISSLKSIMPGKPIGKVPGRARSCGHQRD